MLIVNQRGDTTVNMDNILYIDINVYDNTADVEAVVNNSQSVVLGSYSSKEKAKMAVDKIHLAYFKFEMRWTASVAPPLLSVAVLQMPSDEEIREDFKE